MEERGRHLSFVGSAMKEWQEASLRLDLDPAHMAEVGDHVVCVCSMCKSDLE